MDLEEYKSFIENLVKKINSIYSNLTFTTIDEILKNEIDLNKLYWAVSDLNDSNWAKYQIIQSNIESMGDDWYDEYGYEIESELGDLKNYAEDKIMALQSLINYLDDLENLNEEEDILNNFNDIKQINI